MSKKFPPKIFVRSYIIPFPEPIPIHFGNKFPRYRVSRAFADYGIHTAKRTECGFVFIVYPLCRIVFVKRLFMPYPFFYDGWRKDFQTIKTTAYSVFFQRVSVIYTIFVRRYEVTVPHTFTTPCSLRTAKANSKNQIRVLRCR